MTHIAFYARNVILISHKIMPDLVIDAHVIHEMFFVVNKMIELRANFSVNPSTS